MIGALASPLGVPDCETLAFFAALNAADRHLDDTAHAAGLMLSAADELEALGKQSIPLWRRNRLAELTTALRSSAETLESQR